MLPLVMGLILNRWFGGWAVEVRKYTGYFDQSVILAIVYTSFSNSFSNGQFSNLGIEMIAIIVLALILLFVFINMLIFLFVRRAGLPRADLITALFCGSTKSLMHGSVMAKVMFGSAGAGGIILLPILIYHALQLTFSGIMSRLFSIYPEQVKNDLKME